MRIKTSFNVQRRVTRRQSKLHPYICTTLCYLVTIKTVSICTTLCHLVSIKTSSKCTTLCNLVTIKNVVKMYNDVSPCVNQTLSICTTQCHLVTIKHSQNVQRHATLCQSKHPQNVQPSVTLSICPTKCNLFTYMLPSWCIVCKPIFVIYIVLTETMFY